MSDTFNGIALYGYAQSGKDTFINLLNKLDPNYRRFAFADELKMLTRNGTLDILKPYNDELEKLYNDIAISVLYLNRLKTMHNIKTEHEVPVEKFIDKSLARAQRNIWMAVGAYYRHHDINFWVKSAINRYNLLRKNNKNIKPVITDMRFRNEYELIKKAGFMMCRVIRPIERIVDGAEWEFMDNAEYNEDIFNIACIDWYKKVVKVFWVRNDEKIQSNKIVLNLD